MSTDNQISEVISNVVCNIHDNVIQEFNAAEDVEQKDYANKDGRSRGYMIVINNPKPQDYLIWKSINPEFKPKVKHAIYQLERGSNGTLHMQGGIYFENQVLWRSVKKMFPRAFVEDARKYGAVTNYSRKDRTRVTDLPDCSFVYGEPPEQGRRKDLEILADEILNGTRVADLAKVYPEQYVRHHRGLHALENSITPHRQEAARHIWIYGPSGVGKTSYIYEQHARKNVYVKDGTIWWNGYNNHPVIVIDDFDGRWPLRDFLRLFDKWDYEGQTKGGHVKIRATHIYVTCDKSIKDIAQGYMHPTVPGGILTTYDENIYIQIARRFHEILEFEAEEEYKAPIVETKKVKRPIGKK